MDIKIIRKNGTEYLLSDYDIKTLDFAIGSPANIHKFEPVTGRAGSIDAGTDIGPRNITLKVYLKAENAAEFVGLRNTLYSLFDSRESFYVIDTTRDNGYRWEVKTGDFAIEQITSTQALIEIPLTCMKGFAESVQTTLEVNTQAYTKTTSNFTINNAGEKIDPRERPLKIKFTGASLNLRIRNNTTGEEWQHTGTSAAGNIILLDGVRATKSGLSIFGTTNRKLITLAPGNNSFTITGASGSWSISFDFRFYKL